MAAITLLESSKQMPEGQARAAVQIYGSSYQPLQALSFLPEPTGTHKWTVEDTISPSASRAVGADYTASNGTFKPYSTTASIYGGKVQVDRAIRKTNPTIVPAMKANKIKGHAKKFVVDMFEGQGGSDLKGISKWISEDYTGQAIDGGAAVITMALMDQLYDLLNVVSGSSFFYMCQTPFNALNVLSRTNATGQQNIQYVVDQFGTRIPFFNNVPIIVLKDGKGVNLLSTAEGTTGAHTGGTACSVYGVTYGPEMYTGFQSGGMDVIEDKDATNFENFVIEHIAGTAPEIPRSIARIYNVKNSLT